MKDHTRQKLQSLELSDYNLLVDGICRATKRLDTQNASNAPDTCTLDSNHGLAFQVIVQCHDAYSVLCARPETVQFSSIVISFWSWKQLSDSILRA